MKATVAVVDDHYLFRNGLISLLRDYKGIEVIMSAANGTELMEALVHQQPQVVLLDIRMPGMDGLQAISLMRQQYPDIRIIMLSSHDEDAYIYHLMEKGANSYLPKNVNTDILVEAIFTVVDKGYYFNEDIARAMAQGLKGSYAWKQLPPHTTCTLSEREIDVVRLICKQMTVREMAETLYLSPRTIESHRESILRKTGARNVVGIAFYALQHRLLGQNPIL